MRLTRLRATNVLSYEDLDLDLSNGLTVVVGPNGSGKSNLIRLVDIVRQAVVAAADNNWGALEHEFAAAGRSGATAFEIKLDLIFDREDEKAAWNAWVHAAITTKLLTGDSSESFAIDWELARHLDPEISRPLEAGVLVVSYDAKLRPAWQIRYEIVVLPAQDIFPSGGPAYIMMTTNASELVQGNYQTPSLHKRVAFESIAQAFSIMGSPAASLRARPYSPIGLALIMRTGRVEFYVLEEWADREPTSLSRLRRLVPLPEGAGHGTQAVGAPYIMAHFLSRIILASNTRQPILTQVRPTDLIEVPSIEDGAGAAGLLLSLKVGDIAQRQRFDAVVTIFKRLTGRGLDVQQQFLSSSEGWLLVVPQVIEHVDGHEIEVPLRLAGAGASEALVLALMLTTSDAPVLLDEPGTNLSSSAQRLLLETLRSIGIEQQIIVITHTPQLVPARKDGDLAGVVRIQKRNGASIVTRFNANELTAAENLMRFADVRALLFADGVLLVEGATDEDALSVWLGSGPEGLATPETANVVIYNVGGDSSFAAAIRLLTSLKVPWAALADGPALRHDGGPLAYLVKPDGFGSTTSFADALVLYNNRGVYCLANDFWFADKPDGDRPKRGEIEYFFYKHDYAAWQSVASMGSKIRSGITFARAVPDVPREVTAIWRNILARFGK